MVSTILIIGGGQAGVQAVDSLRRQGYAGRLLLIGEEPYLPYQRPPLSKKPPSYSKTTRRSLTSTCKPGVASTSVMVPSCSARTVVSIFMASSVNSTSPRESL